MRGITRKTAFGITAALLDGTTGESGIAQRQQRRGITEGFFSESGHIIIHLQSLYSAGICQPEIPALYRQPALLRLLPLLVVPICAKGFR